MAKLQLERRVTTKLNLDLSKLKIQLDLIKKESIKPNRSVKKRKVRQYIYSLDIPEVEKHILFKSQYKHDHRYNSQIVDYLNDRKDITYRQMADVLTELGMTVDEEGYITW